MVRAVEIFIYEHVSGGGCITEELPSSVLAEGFGMLKTIISDFTSAGHTVRTFLDVRLQKLSRGLQTSKICLISSSRELEEKLRQTLESVDWSYIIAPESGGVLQELVRKAELTSARSLNSSSKAVRQTSNKSKTFKTLKQKNVMTPETYFLKLTDPVRKIRERTDSVGYPLVFKPVDGVSCEGLSLVKESAQVGPAIQKVKKNSSTPTLIVQKFVEGVHASVSLLSTGDCALPLTLNKQLLSLNVPSSPSTYEGGIVPFQHSLRKEAFSMAKRAVEAFPGLRGYVGVDLVLTEKNSVVVEINPRLTTSYIGMRKILMSNPAHAIMQTAAEATFPQRVQRSGVTFFSKVSVACLTQHKLPKLFSMKEVVTPPLVIPDTVKIPALLVSFSRNLKDAKKRFSTAVQKIW